MLLALAAGTALAAAINAGLLGVAPVRTLGAIPAPWPVPHLPQIDLRALPELLGLAFALTIVALAQSVSIAKAVATRSGQRRQRQPAKPASAASQSAMLTPSSLSLGLRDDARRSSSTKPSASIVSGEQYLSASTQGSVMLG